MENTKKYVKHFRNFSRASVQQAENIQPLSWSESFKTTILIQYFCVPMLAHYSFVR